MPIQYKISTAILALTGCLSLLMTGEVHPVMSVGGLAIIPGYYRFFRGAPPAPRRVVGILSGLTFGVFILDSIFFSADVFLAVAHLTVTFQAIKSFDLKEPWDHLQVYFMSLLQIVVASELTRSLAFGSVLGLFMVMLVTAMILSHLLKEGGIGKVPFWRPVVVILSMTTVTTLALFLALPRGTQNFLGSVRQETAKRSGFSERIEFGSFAEVKLDPSVVMRVELDGNPEVPLYWRGLTMDYFDGRAWKNSVTSRTWVRRSGDEFLLRSSGGQYPVDQTIFLEPLESEIIFGLEAVSSLATDVSPVMTDEGMNIYMPGRVSRRIQYRVRSNPWYSAPGVADARYLQLPPGMSRVTELAREIAGPVKTSFEKAQAIEAHLRQNYQYSLAVPPPLPTTNAVEDFLFRTKRGYCEHYATAMVIMLRGIGVPARIVTGYSGGERNDYAGYIIVRQSEAHSWVEALTDGLWKRFDPTPPAAVPNLPPLALFLDSVKMVWSRHVIGYSSLDQRRIIEDLARTMRVQIGKLTTAWSHRTAWTALALLLLVTGGLLVLRLFRPGKKQRPGEISKRYLVLRKTLKRNGFPVTAATTPGDIRRGLLSPAIRGDVLEFLSVYEECRFGRRVLDRDEERRHAELLRRVRRNGNR